MQEMKGFGKGLKIFMPIDYVIPFVNCSDKDWRQSDRAMKSYGYQLE